MIPLSTTPREQLGVGNSYLCLTDISIGTLLGRGHGTGLGADGDARRPGGLEHALDPAVARQHLDVLVHGFHIVLRLIELALDTRRRDLKRVLAAQKFGGIELSRERMGELGTGPDRRAGLALDLHAQLPAADLGVIDFHAGVAGRGCNQLEHFRRHLTGHLSDYSPTLH